jgi:RND family efflux transporter MFP subunit
MRIFYGSLPVIVGALLVTAGCSHQDDQPRLGEVDRLPRLETFQPERTTLTVQSDLAATVDALEKADLCAQIKGIVKTIPDDVDIGRPVREGDPLITLDIPDVVAEQANKNAMLEQATNLKDQAIQAVVVAQEEVKEAQAQVKRYEADLEKRELSYMRLAKLAIDNTVNKQLADEAKVDRDAAQAALAASQAQILTKEARKKAAETELKVADSRIKVAQAEVARLDALVSYGTIRAPFNGVITKRWVDRGAMVKDTTTPLLTVMRTDKVRVILDVPERDVPLIRVKGSPSTETRGNSVVLRLPALKASMGRWEFQGNVTLKASALDPVSRTMRVEVHLDNPDQYLRPQMTGTATIQLGERLNVLTIPSSALVRNGNKVLVYYLDGLTGNPLRGMVKKVEVEVGLDDGRRVEIQKGLTGTEQIITRGSGVVHSGERAISVPARKVEGE